MKVIKRETVQEPKYVITLEFTKGQLDVAYAVTEALEEKYEQNQLRVVDSDNRLVPMWKIDYTIRAMLQAFNFTNFNTKRTEVQS